MDIAYNEETRDFILSNGDLVILDDSIDLLMQRLFVRFKTFNRELFWELTYGIDYLKDVFGKGRVKSTIDSLFRSQILDEPMVSELVDFQSTIKDYSYQCVFKVKSKEESNRTITYYILQTENGINLLDENGDGLVIRLA